MELFIPLGAVVGDRTVVAYLGGHANSQVLLTQGREGDFVALKVLRAGAFSSSALDAYQQEAERPGMSRMRRSRVVRDGQVPYAEMPYLAGEDLGRLLERYPRLHSSLAREIIGQAAEAVAAAHSAGCVHGALKPGNVFVSAAGGRLEVHVLDLGARYLVVSAQDEATVQMAGSALEYISREQAKGRAPTAQSDVFTLGVLLYRMLTGVVPFPGGVGYGAREARPVRELVPGIDPALGELTDRVLTARGPESVGIEHLCGLRVRVNTTTPPLGDQDDATKRFHALGSSAGPAAEPTVTLSSEDTRSVPLQEKSVFFTAVPGPVEIHRDPPMRASGSVQPRWTTEKKLIVANVIFAGVIILSIIILAVSGCAPGAL